MHAHRGSDDEPPTVRPPFDPQKFARDSERALRAEEATRESAKPTMRPPPGTAADSGFPPTPPGQAASPASAVRQTAPSRPLPSTSGGARPEEDRAAEGGQLLVQLSVDDDDVPFLAIASEHVRAVPLSPIARAFLRHVNQRDCVAVICSRAGIRMDDAVVAIEELSGAGILSFQRSTR
jgi:hypothetical protein